MPTSRHTTWLGRVGIAFVAAGLAVGGWVGWQFVGTNWQAERVRADLIQDVEQEWRLLGDVPAHRWGGAVETGRGVVSAVVRIPRFGADYAVPVLEGTSDGVLAVGFGHFDESAAAGARGNYALAAHRVTHGEPLRRMPELRPGDEVVVDTARWTYTYVLDTAGDQLTVPFTAGWVLADLPRNPRQDGVQPLQRPGQRLLTLTTCSELFHTDDRLVAFGHLAAKEPRLTGETATASQ